MEMFNNPFRPGAGQPPPYLAGREKERNEFKLLLQQNPILKNLILTGLRGVGKTVLLETLKPICFENNWFWAGTDLSESASVSEQSLAIRILVDLAALVSPFTIAETKTRSIGFNTKPKRSEVKLTFPVLQSIYENTPGLEVDKLKYVLEVVWETVNPK